MGTWATGINSNDTAQDLKGEYQAAFYYNDVETAVKKIDKFIRENMFDESDEEEWCNYFYSLSDYMWKKGILTDEIRDKAISMIDSGFGLELWEAEGEKVLKKRKEVLEKFKTQLLTPLPPKKKITISFCTKPIFNTGDIIALQLQTAEKTYAKKAMRYKQLTDDQLHSADGKYILVRKVYDHISYTSCIEPNVQDIWPVFQLFDGLYDSVPENTELSELKEVTYNYGSGTSLFYTEGGKGRFQKRKAVVIKNDTTGISELMNKSIIDIFLSINHEYYNADSFFLSAMSDFQ